MVLWKPSSLSGPFLTLIEQKDNAEIIGEDLRLEGKYGRRKQAPEIPTMPLPFLLTTEFENTLETHASAISFSNSFLHADMGSTQGGMLLHNVQPTAYNDAR